jgi:hypothetical protein
MGELLDGSARLDERESALFHGGGGREQEQKWLAHVSRALAVASRKLAEPKHGVGGKFGGVLSVRRRGTPVFSSYIPKAR